ncbi:hypothetical protein N7530_008938 [Penicillium desertorum]|uniref:Uncharacterized protein n=1 Tax=Penicillium desertorum TaxID=1303715 RepID=A0A9W9WQC0_9EURO|nr:hypothetical protein N7530_008938 [Penicillium desertorum]
MLEQVLPSGSKVVAAPAASHTDIEPLPGRRPPITAARRDLWAIGREQRLCSVTDRITPHRIASHRIASHRHVVAPEGTDRFSAASRVSSCHSYDHPGNHRDHETDRAYLGQSNVKLWFHVLRLE